MSSTEGVIVDNASSSGSVPGSPNKNKVKFFCSHGGKILPRPDNGLLKYVGGETRVISVSRDIKFQGIYIYIYPVFLSFFRKMIRPLIEGDMVLKYQLMPEDLDALVTVKTDEDLRHMFDEYDRCYESTATPRFRAFLFPAHPVVIQNHGESNATIEQRYTDAINGIVRTMAATGGSIKQHQVLDINPNGSPVISSSSSSSPTSPESNYTEAKPPLLQNIYHHSRRGHMHRVQSSPTIYNHQISPNNSNQHQKHHRNHYHPCKPMIDPKHRVSSRPERLISVRSFGRAEGVRYQIDHSPSHHYYSYSKHAGGNGFCSSKCAHFDEYASCSSDWRMERPRSLSPSPLSLSPSHSKNHNNIVHKVFDG